jgi:asparagine synthase (glutamine-hydrolysing)
MCGIAGVVSFDSLTDADRRMVAGMNESLLHRGPDSRGTFAGPQVEIAMRRLSIIDVEGGRQPFYNEARTMAVVCNGEIYNYVELKRDLEAKGHRFSSGSDVEVVVHLYEEMGVRCLDQLRGMFALALWDAAEERLILARDRMGEKPLYWYRDSGARLWFASEMKSLRLAIRACRPEPSLSSVRLFLTYQYVPDPLTMFEEVRKLPAGHYLEVAPGRFDFRPQPYWDYLSLPEITGEPISLVRAELETACRIMGRSDVPVGIALSGGLDSAAVAALSAKTYPGTLQAFSVGYAGRPSMDERLAAEGVARHLGIPFHEVEIGEDDVVRTFPHLVWAMDDPIADIATYGYYAVSALARERDVPVLLSGLGGDELFWGYSWIRDQVSALDRRARRNRLSRWVAGKLLGRSEGNQRLVLHQLHPDLTDAETWAKNLLVLRQDGTRIHDVPEEQVRYPVGSSAALPLSDLLNRTWLASNCLALADRVSMANSVELRVPLLDAKLVELVVGLRKGGMKDWAWPHKRLLVEAVKDLVPAWMLNRPKQGFTPPVLDWYNAICRRYASLLEGGSLVGRGIVPEARAQSLWSTAPLGIRYKLILLEVWSRMYVEGQSPQEVAEAAGYDAVRGYRAANA